MQWSEPCGHSSSPKVKVFLLPRAPQLFDPMTLGIIKRTFGSNTQVRTSLSGEEKLKRWAREMVHSVKHLPCEHEFHRQDLHKKLVSVLGGWRLGP